MSNHISFSYKEKDELQTGKIRQICKRQQKRMSCKFLQKQTINHFCLNNLYQTAGLEGIPLSYDFLQRRKNPMVCHARPEEAEQPAAGLQGAWRKGN